MISPGLSSVPAKSDPIITESGSDSATLDNEMQFLVVNGRSLPHAVLMLIPEAWQNNSLMDPELPNALGAAARAPRLQSLAPGRDARRGR